MLSYLKFGSWTYDETQVNATNKSERGQLDAYMPSNEWFLMDVLSRSESVEYECCSGRYTYVIFAIKMRRRTLYYLVNMLAPCVLIAFMSLLSFALPPDCDEKIGLEVSVLLSIVFHLESLNEHIPSSSMSVPKLSIHPHLIRFFYTLLCINTHNKLLNLNRFVLQFGCNHHAISHDRQYIRARFAPSQC